MPNMSYCRFQNTLRDLIDCYNNMETDDLSPEEARARTQLIVFCEQITLKYSGNDWRC